MTFTEIAFTEAWRRSFADAHIGVLGITGVDNSGSSPRLTRYKRALEERLRARYGGLTRAELQEHPVLRAYRDYYKRFGNSYHVQLQLESVVFKDKSLPEVSPLVDANFAAELGTFVLTAAHDAARLEPPLTIDVTREGDPFTQINGQTRTLKEGDMMMRDARAALCTILYGQDQRTAISPQTRNALYVAYAPSGVPEAAVREQLETIRDLVLGDASEAKVASLAVYAAQEMPVRE